MSNSRASRPSAFSARPRWFPTALYVTVTVVALATVALQLVGVDLNPFDGEKVATPEAVEFWASDGARVEVAGRNIIQQAAFQGSLAQDGCLSSKPSLNVDCAEVASTLGTLPRRMSALIAETEALSPPASDPTTGEWVAALLAAYREDLIALGRIAAIAGDGFKPVAQWETAVADFNENELRAKAEAALLKMLPNREVSKVERGN